MITCYELYDIHAVFVNVRAYPENPINEKAVSCIVDVINNRKCNHEINQIRTALLPFLSLDSTGAYHFAETQNVYTYFPCAFLKDEVIYSVLISVCNALLNVMANKNTAQIVALADCLHDLPIILVENHYKIPRSFWEKEVKQYRKAWDKSFLTAEEKR